MNKSKDEIAFESTQQQAVASWINYLNQIRLEELTQSLNEINEQYDLKSAIKILDETSDLIKKEIIAKNIGSNTGMHGFIAECAEVGVNNAWLKYENKIPNYIWLNDNGIADIQKGDVFLQLKFYNSDNNNFSLEAVKKHLETYPDFLKNGGKYEIPKDQLKKIKELLEIPPEIANKMPTSDGTFSLKQWRKVHEFFNNENINISDFEESRFDYKDIQRETIHKVLDKEKQDLNQHNQSLKEEVYLKSKPSFSEGLKATEASALIEGGASFIMAVHHKMKSGKQINNFDQGDWEDILKESGIGTIKGGIRGASIYMLTNYAKAPAAVVSALTTATFTVAQQAYLLKTGELSEEEFLNNSVMVCLDTSVSALSSIAGQVLIPFPILGAVIGNTVGTMLYQIARNNLSEKEQELIQNHIQKIREMDERLDSQYKEFLQDLDREMESYYRLLDAAFSPNYKDAFEGSITLALNFGVPYEKVLKNIDEINDYFLA